MLWLVVFFSLKSAAYRLSLVTARLCIYLAITTDLHKAVLRGLVEGQDCSNKCDHNDITMKGVDQVLARPIEHASIQFEVFQVEQSIVKSFLARD